MDTVTQIVLGAAVGRAVAGRQVGRKAAVWGAICGTLPDLDVFVPLGNAVMDFTYHRSASHSLLILALLTPVVVWLILKLHPGTREYKTRWLVAVYLCFATHVLLDCFTVYGTQIFWPLSELPIAWSSIFIIDPLYTLALVIGSLAGLIGGKTSGIAQRINALGLVLSSFYLVWTLGAKYYVDELARQTLAEQDIRVTGILVSPAPFNTILWRILAVNEQHYYEGLYSLLDGDRPPTFDRHPRNLELIRDIETTWPVRRLSWFSKDFFAVAKVGNTVSIQDLRMGLEPDYVFRFAVGETRDGKTVEGPVRRLPPQRKMSRLQGVWKRIWTPVQ